MRYYLDSIKHRFHPARRTSMQSALLKLLSLALAASLALFSSAAGAQAWPNKPVRILIAFPPGGAIDIVARVMSPKLSESLGQPVLVENRPGAGGLVGTELAAKAAPDGYTVFFGTLGNLSVNPLLYPKLPFDIGRDFAPLTQVVSTTFMLYVNPSLPVKSVADLIAYAKARPGGINYSSSGNGGAPHLAGELFNSMTGVKMVHVPYKGSSQSVTDVMGGQVQLTFDSLALGLPYVKAGKLRAVATLGPKRIAQLPDVPAVNETLPGYEVTNWFGMVIPAATPKDIVTRLHAEILRVLRLPEVRDSLVAQGTEPVGSSPEEFGAFMKSEAVKWARVIREANIRAD
jgi:tripartite-type tricarboxylate transporter receptor subunit TctC